MANSFIIQPTESYPACHYVVKNPSTWNPAATSSADLDGCTTLAVGERVLCPSGASVGIYVASSATVCVADAGFVRREGYTVSCVRSAGSPVYRQTAASGTAAFSLFTTAAPTTTNYYGSMVLRYRGGAEVPFPEYKSTDGTYIALPEPIWDTCKFELSVLGGAGDGVVAIQWRDARHIGTTTHPAGGTGSLVGGALDATLTYGEYTLNISGDIAAGAFTGMITTKVREVVEVHEIILNTETSDLTFTEGVYYSEFGNDLLDGLSLKSPKLTPPTPAASVEGDVYYLERGSIFRTGYIGHPYVTVSVIGVGAGHRPVGNSFDVVPTWTDAGGGAWSMQFVAPATPIFEPPATLSRTQVAEDGIPLKQVADLAAVQATLGSYAYSGAFVGGDTVTVWIHPAADPNTSGKVYEVVKRQGFACAMGATRLENLIGRGGTSRQGVIVHRPSANAAADVQCLISNCIASHGITHTFAHFGGTMRDSGSLFCKGQEVNETSAHYVLAINWQYYTEMTWDIDNCFAINNADHAVFGDAAVFVENGAPSDEGYTMNVTFNKWHQAYCGKFGSSMSRLAVTVGDSLIERSWSVRMFGGGLFELTRCRGYQLGDWAALTIRACDDSTTSFVARQCLFAGGFANSAGTGTGFLQIFAHATEVRHYELENCTIVDTGAYSPWISTINMSASANVTFRFSGNLVAGFSQVAWITNDTTYTPTRLTGNSNTLDFNGAWRRLSTTKTFAQWQSGDGVWVASDASSVTSATITFSDTTGRYPRYNQSSAHPGGCTATLIEPTELLGVKVLQALESTGRWPA